MFSYWVQLDSNLPFFLFSLVNERAASAAIRNSKFGNIHVHVCVVFSIRGIKWDFREIFLICRGQTQS